MDVLNVLFSRRDFNQLPDFLCCYTPHPETEPVYILVSDAAHCARQPAADRRAGGGRQGSGGCVFVIRECVSVLDAAFVRFSFIYMCVLHVRVLMCVTGAKSYVRGEVTPPLLRRGVCRGSYQLSESGEHLLPRDRRTHTHTHTHTHPAPWISLAFTQTAGPEETWENGERHEHVFEHVFSDACKCKCCAFDVTEVSLPTEKTSVGKDVYGVTYGGDVCQLLRIRCVATLINLHS